MGSNPLIRAAIAAAIALPLAGAAEGGAEACENATIIITNNDAPRIARAERALKEGNPTLAAVGVLQVFPRIRASQPEGPLLSRALRVMAIAAVRTNGALTAGKQWRGATPEEKSANLSWAITTLRTLSKVRAKNPSFQTDLGEALSKVAAHKNEALKILGELAEKDLITSAHGYAALAKLREDAGDKAGSEAALKRCQTMTTAPGVCMAAPQGASA